MSNYYGYGGQQQSGGGGSTGGGFYGNAGGYGQQQQQQQQPPPQQQQFQQQQQQQPPGSGNAYGGPNQQHQQWQQPQQQTTQPSGAQTTQQQPANFWNPAAAAAAMSMAGSMANGGLSNDAVLDLASNAGKTFLQSGTARMMPGMQGFMGHLRTYFAVDNRYVKRKMQKVLFPFVSKNWRRLQSDPMGPEMQVQYDLPLSDENAPDLYLPFMSLITYVLLCALCYGSAGKFDPEVLPDVTSKCIMTQVLEVLAIRFGFYMLQAPIAVLDLVSYTGYKYLGLCMNMLVGLVLSQMHHGHTGYYITFLWTASAQCFFILKTMANNIPIVTAATGPKREVMVVGFAASQLATMWFVSQTKFLS